jgi:hypothetical protein
MPINEEDLYRSSSFRSHGDRYYEWIEHVKLDLPRARILTRADIPRIGFSDPPKHTFWEEVEDWMECIANGGRPG